MTLVVEMDDLDKEDFMIRCRRNKTSASAVVRSLIVTWMRDHPDTQKLRMKPAID